MPAYRWVHRNARQGVPDTAVSAGHDSDGTTIYVGRAYHEGDMLPAKVIPEKNIAYVCYEGKEYGKHDFEVLCRSEFSWEVCSNGSVPSNAVVAGQTSGGEPLYVGRVFHDGSQTVGKVHPTHGCLYIPYAGTELSFQEYEVLVNN
ncbi:natterin-3-like [Osmia bicornis bicornis]|uniref:natterin-3-like n=1 Tax=Osmia bicornis bicornis TaxID=1437191 RepID=UPI0010F777E0|nr:natterin-3-like [Osmia bicornis bicornis]